MNKNKTLELEIYKYLYFSTLKIGPEKLLCCLFFKFEKKVNGLKNSVFNSIFKWDGKVKKYSCNSV